MYVPKYNNLSFLLKIKEHFYFKCVASQYDSLIALTSLAPWMSCHLDPSTLRALVTSYGYLLESYFLTQSPNN